MKSPKHTPAPWKAETDPCHFDTLSTVTAGEIRGSMERLVVQVGGHAGVAEQEANTRLITAAPDMLAALQELSALCERVWEGSIVGKPIRNQAKRAIAKALDLPNAEMSHGANNNRP